MRKALAISFVLAVLALVPAHSSCRYSQKCPSDGSQMYMVGGVDYSNGHEMATYEHRTIGGTIHRFAYRCN